MFEYLDDELGKIKLVNVTEARANFAKLLADDGHYYVITKNNKPQRVVISYEEFRQLRQSQSSLAADKLSAALAQHPETEKPAAKQPIVRTQSRVKGLLSQHLGGSEPTDWSDAAPPAETFQPATGPSALQSETPEPDYFQTAEVLPETEEVPPTEPDHLFRDDEDTAVSEDTLLLAELTEPEDLTLDHLETPETHVPNPQTEAAPEDTALTREEQEYYQKYRKLYENHSPVTATSQPSQVRLEEEDPRLRQIVDSLPALDLEEEAVEAPEHALPSSPPLSDFVDDTSRAPTPAAAPDILHTLTDDQGDLPSLQELLRELDPEGESPNNDLADHEIEKIVRRIREEE